MRGANGDLRAANSALETVNAAANVIAAAENHMPQARIQKRRWSGCLSVYWCFGSLRRKKRMGPAALVPLTSSRIDTPTAETPIQPPAITLPFVAPPSSPASFLQSDPPSSVQSPSGLLSLTSISANMYSPGGPNSIFAIGPYAHETQLVSPPVFSSFTTEPSTAPFTPPPESVHLTTPSSPEVPFAHLLQPKISNGESGKQYSFPNNEFQSYQFYPGSPVSHLISPSSGISGSGTSSPFPDCEFDLGVSHFLKFPARDPPRLLVLDKLSTHDWGSRQGSGSLTPDAVRSNSHDDSLPSPQTSKVISDQKLEDGGQNDDSVTNGEQSDELSTDRRMSFELTAEDFLRSAVKRSLELAKLEAESLKQEGIARRDKNHEGNTGQTSYNAPESATVDLVKEEEHENHLANTFGSVKEFNFDNPDGGDALEANIGSDWWANEKVVRKESDQTRNWAFFPIMQPQAHS